MTHQIIRQPNGLLSVFSTAVEDFIIIDVTAAHLAEYYAAKAALEARTRTNEITAAVLAGRAREVYGQFTMTHPEALRARDFRHRPHDPGCGTDGCDPGEGLCPPRCYCWCHDPVDA